MNNFTIRDQIQARGYSSIEKTEKDIAKALENTDEMNQLDLIKLQQKTGEYSNTISMMSNMLKNLGETDKEVIRNT